VPTSRQSENFNEIIVLRLAIDSVCKNQRRRTGVGVQNFQAGKIGPKEKTEQNQWLG
jgi:hypothetical protein